MASGCDFEANRPRLTRVALHQGGRFHGGLEPRRGRPHRPVRSTWSGAW